METVLVSIRVTPRARTEDVTITDTGEIRIRVRSAPSDGAANHAAVRLLAKALHVPPTSLHLKSGHRNRNKLVEVTGLSYSEIVHRLGSFGPRGKRADPSEED